MVMITAIRRMADALLTLAQLFSPAYPVGGFHFSHGLEWAIDAEQITDGQTLLAWLEDILRHGSGWNDAVLLTASYRSPEPASIDETARAFAASSERLAESREMGAAFSRITSRITGQEIAPLMYPVAVGQAARRLALPLDMTLRFYLHAFASNLAGAAMRAMPLGQTEGQRIIRATAETCVELAEKAVYSDLDDLCSGAFFSDIAAMRHETQYSRIFKS